MRWLQCGMAVPLSVIVLAASLPECLAALKECVVPVLWQLRISLLLA